MLNLIRSALALRGPVLGAAAALAAVLSGCSPHPLGGDTTAALPPLPGGTNPPALFAGPPVSKAVVLSELVPALLVHSDAAALHFFGPDPAGGSSAPRFAAFGANGPKIVTNGLPADVSKIQERWVLAWFTGARGWEKADCPVGILLQHPPTGLSLDTNGLHLRFAGPAGDVLVMPLHGARALPTSAAEIVARGIPREEAKKLPKVWEWSQAVPRDPLTRLRYWSSALARYPVEAFGSLETGVEGPLGARFHAAFRWYPIPHTWDIPPLRIAPLSRALAGAALAHPEEQQFTSLPFDMDWPTLDGPLKMVPETDAYAVTFKSGAAGSTAPWWWSAIGRDPAAKPAADAGWQPWTFRSAAGGAGSGSRMPLRLRAGSSVLEWTTTNATGRVTQSLGVLRAEGEGTVVPRVERLNPDTEIWRWEKP